MFYWLQGCLCCRYRSPQTTGLPLVLAGSHFFASLAAHVPPLQLLSSLDKYSITANQHPPCPRNTQLPCQVIAEKRFHIWLPSILLHMPSKELCLSPIKVLIPTVSGASTPPRVMDWPKELCQSGRSTPHPSHYSWFFCVHGQWAPFSCLQTTSKKTKLKFPTAWHIAFRKKTGLRDCTRLFPTGQ